MAAGSWLGVMNGLRAVFNLLPGAPLDGGRVLRAALWRHYGDRDRAAAMAACGGRYLGALLADLGLAELMLTRSFLGGLWLVLIGWFLTSAAAAEQSAVATSSVLRGLRVADVMTPDPGWASVAEFASRLAAASWAQRAFPVLGRLPSERRKIRRRCEQRKVPERLVRSHLPRRRTGRSKEIAMPRMLRRAAVVGGTVRVASQRGQAKAEGAQQQDAAAAPPPPPAQAEAPAAAPAGDPYGDLMKLKELLDAGALTQAEFDAQKQKILGA